jgi:hypothetical protein
MNVDGSERRPLQESPERQPQVTDHHALDRPPTFSCAPIYLFAIVIATIASAAVILLQSSFVSDHPTSTSSAFDATHFIRDCSWSKLRIANYCPENVTIRVYFDSPSWQSWNWTTHPWGFQAGLPLRQFGNESN